MLQYLRGQVTLAQSREEEFALLLLDVAAACGGASLAPEEVDRRLRVLSRALRQTVRDADFLSRSNRPGFAVVLPRCGEREASQIARRLLEQVDREQEAEALPPGGVDLGMSFYPRDGASAPVLLRAAERRMLDRDLSPRS
jgi:GGDEF domain-containing protein